MKELSNNLMQQAHRMIADYPEAMVAVFNHDGQYLFASANHETILGYAPADLLGTRLGDIIAVEDQEHLNLALMDTLLAGKSIEIGVNIIKRDGDPLRCRAQAQVIEDPDTGEKYMLGWSVPVTA